MDAYGKPIQIGSKVRVFEHTSESLGVVIPAYTGEIVDIVVDQRGSVLLVRSPKRDHDRAVRPEMVKRRRFRAAA